MTSELLLSLLEQSYALAAVAGLSTLVSTRELVPADFHAVHRKRADSVVDHLLAASARLGDNLLARLAIAVVAIVVALVAAWQVLHTLLEA